MSESARHRLVLWFMRDLSNFQRAPLFLLFGITHPGSNLEQQKAFEKILDDCKPRPQNCPHCFRTDAQFKADTERRGLIPCGDPWHVTTSSLSLSGKKSETDSLQATSLKKLAAGCRIKADLYAKAHPEIPASFHIIAHEIDRIVEGSSSLTSKDAP